MRFGPKPTHDAQGAILAHSLPLPGGGRIRKGRVLTSQDVERLVSAGVDEVTVAIPGPSDLGENDAARIVADALAGPGVAVRRPATGRCNLEAECAGVVRIDRERIDALNRVHESVTVSTLRPDVRAEAGTLVATVKVIPYAAPRSAVGACVDEARAGPGAPIRIDAFLPRSVALIQTRHPGTSADLLDRSAGVLRRRVESLGCRLVLATRCAHANGALTTALEEALAARPDLVLVEGASAPGDRGDVVPAAIEALGGTVVRLGLPIDPGNLTVIGTRGPVAILGVPGCARSPRRNGFDEVLERLVAGEQPAELDVAGMGVGGLLKESPERTSPRSRRPGGPSPSRVAAIVLAAGSSRRMGDVNKLTARVGDQAIVRRAVEPLLDAGLDPVVVVTGPASDDVQAALDGLPVAFAWNEAHGSGMGSSVRVGIQALPPDVDGALVALGDMPWVTEDDVLALTGAFDPAGGAGVCVPVRDRKRGNPVLWGRAYFDDLLNLDGDTGARHLLATYADEVVEVPVFSDGVLLDVDTPEALDRARSEGT